MTLNLVGLTAELARQQQQLYLYLIYTLFIPYLYLTTLFMPYLYLISIKLVSKYCIPARPKQMLNFIMCDVN